MGIDHSRVKMAIKKRLENSGNAFDNTEQLISAAFSIQHNQERRNNRENLNPVGAVLGRLGEAGHNDTVTERWEVGQEATEDMDDDMEDIQPAPDTSNDTISLNQPNSLQQTPSPSASNKPPENLPRGFHMKSSGTSNFNSPR